ncbi:MAG: hypothetical protein GWO02_18270 [Gammaproteobacteria bacterium]|nr:hypothetical protein [Gammaproteobacteria bacterium]
MLFAAVAALAVLGEEAYGEIQGRSRQPLYTQAGILGGTYFATAVAAYLLARRLRESEALAEQRGLDLANMAQLNDYIIQHMQAGLVVIDPQVRIRLINDSAWYLLGMPAGGKDKRLEDVSPELAERFQAWEETESDAHVTLHPRHGPGAVMARFERLGQDAGDSVLILLEDASVTTQQMQQMKLASLGRLTASIAHEIRNPLGAISHAAQLLDEGEDTGQANRRLAEIIRNHTHRMNEIIENVLQLSRRRDSQPQVFALRPWLEDFIETFCSGQSVRPEEIALEVEPANVEVRMDPSHLHQVLWNLCQNALEHAPAPPGSTRLRVRAGRMPGTRGDFLEVIDAGPGVTPEQVEEIFEPFYTTAASGTGLGLYIARELCECNRARIEYVPVPSGGSCFRIWFPELPRQVA